jgi:pimeloyl-ACP methyl ester carboxylesterase
MELNFKKIGSGSPLVILHGLFGSLDNWMTLGKAFAENHTVYLVDQRNHGASPHDDIFDYDAMASDLDKFLKSNKVNNPVLIGHSMGGKTVMRYAQLHPNEWEKLIVVDIAPRSYPVHHQHIIDGLNALRLHEISSRAEADEQLSDYVKDAGQRQFLLKNLQRRPEGGFQWKVNLPVIEKNIELIGEGCTDDQPLHGEVLFIRGSESHYIGEDDYEEILRLFPEAAIETVDGAGHWVHAEKPRELYTLVKNFIDS